ncbi:MAG: type VI secretion system tube protein Hcp [Pirellulaceae bacterium]
MRLLPTPLARRRHRRHRSAQRQTRRQQFYRPRLEALEDRRLLAVDVFGVPEWTEIGPRGIEPSTPDHHHGISTGAVQAIAPLPEDPRVVFVGTVNGGIWKTDDIDAGNGPVWQNLTDDYPSLSISSLDFSPLDSTTVFAGTGKQSSYRDFGNAFGILRGVKTETEHYSWTPYYKGLPANSWISDVLPLALGSGLETQIVIAGSRGGDEAGGLHISRDGGKSWSSEYGVFPHRRTSTPGNVTDLMRHPDPGRVDQFYFSMISNARTPLGVEGVGVWRADLDDKGTATTSDDDFRYTQLLRPGSFAFAFGDVTNIRLASQHIAGTTVLYAGLVIGDWNVDGTPSNGFLDSVLMSADDGQTWDRLGSVGNLQSYSHKMLQGNKHFSLAAHPSIPQLVYIGGDEIPNLWRYYDNDWSPLSQNPQMDPRLYPHVDSRALVFDEHANVLEGDDGGLYKLRDPASPVPRWVNVNGNLGTVEGISAVYDRMRETFTIAMQDNGVAQGSTAGAAWQMVEGRVSDGRRSQGGDGLALAITYPDPTTSLLYEVRNDLSLVSRHRYTQGTAIPEVVNVGLRRPGSSHLSGLLPRDRRDASAQTRPLAVNAVPSASSRLLIAAHGLYESNDHGDTIRWIHRGVAASGGGDDLFVSLVYGGFEPNGAGGLIPRADVVYAGRRDALYVRSANSRLFDRSVRERTPEVTTGGIRVRLEYLTDIAVRPDDWRIAYVAERNRIWRTEDAGASWELIFRTQDLPAMGDIWSLAVAAVDGRDVLLLGTDNGVYRAMAAEVSGPSQWVASRFGWRLPNVPVLQIGYEPDVQGGMLVATTLGRGVWTANHLASRLVESSVARIVGEDPGSAGEDRFLLRRSAENPLLLEVYVNGVRQSFQNADPRRRWQTPPDLFPAAALQSIEVRGGVGDDWLRIDSSHGPLSPRVTFNGGEGDDRLRLYNDAERPTQIYRLDGSLHEVRGYTLDNASRQVVEIQSVATVSLEGMTPQGEMSVVEFAAGLNHVADAVRADAIVRTSLPVVDRSLGHALDGNTAAPPRPLGRGGPSVPRVVGPISGGASTLFRRIVETGPNAFSLTDIGTDRIPTLEDLRQRLDDLDDVPGNVALNPRGTSAGTTLLDVKVVDKALTGVADLLLDTELLGGTVNIAGLMGLQADVTMHIRVGVDDQGFFIDPGNNPDPEFVIRNLRFSGNASAQGQFGIVEASLSGVSLQFDEDIRVSIDLHDPGVGTVDDGYIRLDGPGLFELSAGELTNITNDLMSVSVDGGGSGHDVTLTGTFSVAPWVPGSDSDPFSSLAHAEITLVWPDLAEPTNVQVDLAATSSLGQQFLQLLHVSVDQVAAGLRSLGPVLEQIAATPVLSSRLPLLGRSLSEVLSSAPGEFMLSAAAGRTPSVSEVVERDGYHTFGVIIEDLAFPAEGVAVGDRVYVRTAAGGDAIEATIASVEIGHLTVRYGATIAQLPDRVAPELRIVRQGSLSRRLEAMLGSLTNATSDSFELPTFQELAHQLADLVGIDVAELPITLRTDPLALEWTLPLELAPLEYRQPLNFAAGVPGLTLRSDGAFVFAVAPNMQLTVGMLLEPSADAPLSERFYLADGSQVSLQVDAHVTGSGLTGSLGFVDLLVGTEQLQVTGMVGARLSGAIGNPATPINIDPLLDARLDAVLPVSIDVGRAEPLEILSVQVHQALSTSDDFAAVATSVTEQLASLADFNNITPQMVAQALSALVGQLRRLGLGPVLDAEIPLINQSLADLANLGDTLTDLDGLTAESVGTVKRLAEVLGAEQVDISPQEVRFHFRRDSRFVREIPLAFGVGADFDLLSLSGEGTLQVEAHADGQLALGISTAPGIAPEDRFFLVPQATQFVLGATANVGYDVDGVGGVEADPVTVRAHVLGVPVEISDARVLLRIAGQASLADQDDGAGDDTGKLTLRELAAGGFDAQFVPTEDHLQAILPVDAGAAGIAAITNNQFDPTALSGTGDAVVEILGRLTDLPGGLDFDDAPTTAIHTDVTQVVSPGVGDAITVRAWNLDAFVSEGVLSFDSLLGGLTQLVDWADALLGTDVLDYKLPFINRSLRDGLNFIGTVGATCDGDPETLGELVTCVLVQGLGGTMSEAAEELAQFLADEGAIESLGDLNGDARDDWRDILQIEGDPADPTSVTFQFGFTPAFDPFGTTWHGFDLGTDFLKLTSDDGLTVSFAPDLTMLIGFGVDQDGFFIKTDFDAPEIQMDATLQLQGDARLKLGFVEVGATFGDDDRLSVQLSADLADGATGKVRLSDLLNVHRIERIVDASALVFHVEAGLNVPLALAVDLAGLEFTALEADLMVHWVPVSTSGSSANDPTIELRNVRVPVGELVNRLGGKVLAEIRDRNPLTPLIDVLNEELPVLGMTTVDLLQLFNPGLAENAVWQLLATSKFIDDIADYELNFGDVLFERGGDGTLQKVPGMGNAEDGFHEGTPLADANVPGGGLPLGIGEIITSVATNLGITFPILELSNILNFLVFEKDVDLVRFEFPVPLRIPIFGAYGAEVFSFGIPKLLSVNAGVEFNLGFSFVVDLAVGLDTRGLRRGPAATFGILDGLWIGDFDPNLDGDIVPGGIDRPEIRVEGAIEGAIFGNAEVAGFELGRVRGYASIAAGVGIDLNDDNALHGEIDNRTDADRYDGKFHLDEMALVLADHSHAGHDVPFLCLFDLTGSITAALGIDVKIDLWIKTLKKRFEKNWTLLSFEVGCDATPPAIAAPADYDPRVLKLNGTPEPDHFEIRLIDGNTLRVTKDSQSEDFDLAAFDRIDGDLGDGQDIVFVDSAVSTPVLLSGGPGDDELTAGAGGGWLLGGPGNDTLTAAEISAPVVIVGGGGDDYIRGGSSADELVGDYHPTFDPRPEVDAVEGSDTILGGQGSTWSGTVYPADDTDLIWGDNAAWNADGPAPDAANFTSDVITIETGVARVWAGAGDDVVTVGAGRVTAYGGSGDDTMRGGNEVDVLVGEAGNDTLFGSTGNDQLFGGSYFDPAHPHPPVASLSLGNDQLDGGDGDDLLDGFDSTFVLSRGGQGNDLLIGSQGSDELRGGSGDDIIFAGPGSDLVRGGSGNDVILGGSGTIDGQALWPNFQSASSPRDRTDRLFGDDGDDIIVGDNGRVNRWTLSRTVLFPQDPVGGGGGTTYVPYTLTDYHTEVTALTAFLFGQSDLIVGGTGNDVVLGGDESDLIYGDSDFAHFQGALPLFPPVSAPGHDVQVGDNGEFVRRITYRGSDLFETTHRVTSTAGRGDADTILGDERQLAASGGFDMIFGGDGGDFIWGSGGGDTIFGDLAQFQETWTAAAGFVDRQVFSIVPTLGGDDTIDGGAGIDGVVGGFGNDEVWGSDDADVVLGDHARIAFTATGAPGRAHPLFPETGGDDQLIGGSGTDFVIGGFGRDTLWGGHDDDPNFLFGDNGTVVFADGSGQANTLFTGFDEYGERDTIYGSDGPDYIIAGLGHDVVYGQGGDDQVLGDLGSIFRDELGAVIGMVPLVVLLPVGAQTNDVLWGGSGNDTLHGDFGDDVIRGEDGDDNLFGGVGNDWVAEVTNTFLILSDTQLLGRGVDKLDSFERGNLIGDGHDNLLDARLFSGPVVSGGFGGNDTLIGGRSDDTLDGGDQHDILIGGAGDDYLLGRDGNDRLDGGTGHDRIDAGAGDDIHYALFGTGVRPAGLYHTWTVSTTADAGLGSMRWALENSTTLPADVLVVIPFQIPATDPNFVDVDAASGGDPTDDVHVIAPAVALPVLNRGNVIVNGLSQAFADDGDTNPAGPNIVLDGRYVLLTGLALASDRNQVYGLNLQRFVFAGLNVVGHDNVIAANYIGTDPTASALRWNAQFGIQVNNASGNRIGLPGLGNVIGGNAAVGVLLTGNASSNNVLHGNSIGTDPTGTRALGNGGPGIVIMGAAPSGNVIGGLLSGEGNRIAFNHGEGIYVASSGALGTKIRGNAIYTNDELGIDLAAADVTANDGLDADAGANRLQNYPVITFATMGEQLRVAGTLHSAPLRQYSLDFYASDAADPTGYGEGQRYVGSVVVVTDAVGDAQFDEYLPVAAGADQWITATATEVLLGDTSEFSLAHTVRDVSGLCIVTNTNDSGPGSLRAAIECANGVTTDDFATIEFAIPTTDARFVDVDASLAGGDLEPDVFVISPLSPLPALTRGRIVLDGQSQHNLTGDTNPFGPEIVLNGSQTTGNGLELHSSGNHIHGLNLQQFSGNGILIAPEADASLNGLVDAARFLAATGAFAIAPFENRGNVGISYTTADGLVAVSSASGPLWVGAVAEDLIENDDWTQRLVGAELSISGLENFNVDLAVAAYSFGFEFVEPEHDPNVYAAFVDSTFSVTLKRGGAVVGTFDFNSPSDQASFIGATSSTPFDRIEIRELIGGIENEFFGRMYLGNTPPAANDNSVTGSYIGTNATGTAPITLPPETVGWWPGEGTAEDIAGDHDGMLFNGVSFAPGMVAQAFSFDGVDDHVAIPNGSPITLASGLTLEAWINTTSADAASAYAGNAALNLFGYSHNEVWVGFGVHDGKVRYNFASSDSTWDHLDGTRIVNDGAWHHIAATHEESTGVVSIFVDGVLDGSATFNYHTIDAYGVPVAIDRIGAGYSNFDVFDGLIDEPTVYSQVLSASEIASIYNQGSAGKGAINPANGGSGVVIQSGSGNTIGGTGASQRNVISGNNQFGVQIIGNGHSVPIADPVYVGPPIGTDNPYPFPLRGNTVLGNYIGLGANGGTELGNHAAGIYLQDSANNHVGGNSSSSRNVISANLQAGIDVRGESSTGNRIQANYIGTDSSGDSARGNRAIGIHFNFGAAFNTIGTDGDGLGDEFEGNLISGHTHLPQDSGIWLGIGHDNVVAGNLIGTDGTGTRAIPNDVAIDVRGSGNWIGTNVDGVSDTLERNVISGNIVTGILIIGDAATGTVVQGNFIGVDSSGNQPLGNGAFGIVLTNTHDNRIGGSQSSPVPVYEGDMAHYEGDFVQIPVPPTAGNVISGNGTDGIRLELSHNNVIQGNRIGVDFLGLQAMGNGRFGIYLGESAHNQIGGGEVDAGNVISGNLNGIGIYYETSVDNKVQGNYIGVNAWGSGLLPNRGWGIDATYNVSFNVIGVDGDGVNDATEGNVISGHRGFGQPSAAVYLVGHDNVIAGNLLGTDATGRQAMGNVYGIHMGGYRNRVGTDGDGLSDALERNVIAHNDMGLSIFSGADNVVAGNFIGTDVTGNRALGNGGGIGIELGVLRTRIGTNADGVSDELERNLVSGQGGIPGTGSVGIGIGGIDTVIVGNYVGIGSNGTTPLGNANYGIWVTSTAIGTRIGGTHEAERNVISGNGSHGVYIQGTATIPPDLASWLRADGNAVDSANGSVGRLQGGAAFAEGVAGGQAFALNGSDAFVAVPESLVWDFVTGDFTVELWAWFDRDSESMFLQQQSGNGNGGFEFDYQPASNAQGRAISNLVFAKDANQAAIVRPWSADTNRWYHLAATRTGDTYRIYVDGVELGGPQVTAGPIANVSGPLRIGSSAGGGYFHAGRLDEILIHRRALSPIEIQRTFAAGGRTSGSHTIQGNFIGTAADGLHAQGNAGNGVMIENSSHNLIGGVVSGARNVISGNDVNGVGIAYETATRNRVERNLIGTKRSGNEPLGNTLGVHLFESPGNFVVGNLISGNVVGLNISGAEAMGNTIADNFIGTNIDGTAGVPNTADGVFIDDAPTNTLQDNTISANGFHGVLIEGTGSFGNVLRSNNIGTDVNGEYALGNLQNGVRLTGGASDNRILDNVVSGNRQSGVLINDPNTTKNRLYGNFIGTDADGMIRLPNHDGIVISLASGNWIGGTGPDEGNLISGSARFAIDSSSLTGNLIQGNRIGTDADGNGNPAVWNAHGIHLYSDRGTLVGGAALREGNVIVGSGWGIWLGGLDGPTEGVRIQGNLIGTPDGEEAWGNAWGIYVEGNDGHQVTDLLIGGELPGEGNLVSGHSLHGIVVTGAGARGVRLQGNFIGTNRDGTAAIANAQHGVLVENARGVLIGADGDGIADDREGNIIAYNTSAGISVSGDASQNNSIRGNAIYANGGTGIDLGNDGVTPNDNGNLEAGVVPDLDLGPNALQNFPELQNVQPGVATRVTGLLRSTPATAFVLDFYAGNSADPTGFGEGQRWLGNTTASANSEGVARFNVTLAATTYGGEYVTATATRLRDDGSEADTSEFSAAFAVKAGKGARGANSYTLELVPDAAGDPIAQRFTTLDVELTGVLDAFDSHEPIDVAAFTTAIHASPAGPIGLPMTLAAPSSSLSPLLVEAVSHGTTFGQVILVGSSTVDDVPYEFARWTFDNVRIGSIATRDLTRDEFTLVYDRLAYSYTPLTPRGVPGTPVEGVWDVRAAGGRVPITLPERTAEMTPADHVQYFVDIPGIPGDATLAGYASLIEATWVDFAFLGADDGAGVPAQASTIGVMTSAGSASPRLMAAAASGQVFSEPIDIVAVYAFDTEPVELARWTLDGTSLVSYATASGRRDAFSIAFDSLQYSFTDIGPNGQEQTTNTTTLDRVEQGVGLFAGGIDVDAMPPTEDGKTLLVKVPGVTGDSQLVGYVGWTPVDSFRFQLERPLPGEEGATPPYATSFSFTMPTGKSSPRLFEFAAQGTTFSMPAEVVMVGAQNNKVVEFARWTLDGAEVGDFSTAAAALDGFTLGFDALRYTVTVPPANGGQPTHISAQWNLAESGSQTFNAPLVLTPPLSPSTGVMLLVKLPGIVGNAALAGYTDWVPVDSYYFELTNPLESGDSPALASTFQFDARSSQASPEILRALLSGQPLATAYVAAVWKAGGTKVEEFARWTLRNVQIVSYATDSMWQETFGLHFEGLDYSFGVAPSKRNDPVPETGRWNLTATGAEVVTRSREPADATLPTDVRVLMKIPGVSGESQLAGYQGWVPLDAAAISAARQPTSRGDAVLMSTFGCLAPSGFHSPRVLDALASRQVFNGVEDVKIVTVGLSKDGSTYELARWTLDDAQIASYANQNMMWEGFSVAFDAWQLAYAPLTSQGTVGTQIEVAWDVLGTNTRLEDQGPPPSTTPLPADVELLVKIPGLPGDSPRQGYVGMIDVQSFNVGLYQSLGQPDQSFATPLVFELATGISSPRFLEAVAGISELPYVEIVALRDGQAEHFAEISLANVQFVALSTRDSAHDRLALVFDDLTFAWKKLDPQTGLLLDTATGHWPAATDHDPVAVAAEPASVDAVAAEVPLEKDVTGDSAGEPRFDSAIHGMGDALAVHPSDHRTRLVANGWTVERVDYIGGKYRHTFRKAEDIWTIVTESAWQNPVNPLDTNGDGNVSPLDALLIINHLQVSGDGSLDARGPGDGALVRYLDVTGPNEAGVAFVSPLDALRVINFLNVRGAAESLPAGESDDADGSVAMAGIAGPLDEASQTVDAPLSHHIDGRAPDTDWSQWKQADWDGLLEPIAGHRVSGQRTTAQELATDMAVDLLMHEWWGDAESGGVW